MSGLSITFFIFTIISFATLIVSIGFVIMESWKSFSKIFLISLGVFLFCLLGLIFSLKALNEEEKTTPISTKSTYNLIEKSKKCQSAENYLKQKIEKPIMISEHIPTLKEIEELCMKESIAKFSQKSSVSF